MLKNKDHRILKKNHALLIFKKVKLLKLFNTILVKNSRIFFFKKLILKCNFRTLVPGLKNVCSLTGKYKSTFNALKVSRHVYRNFGDTSILPNFSKMSWLCLKIIKYWILIRV